MTKIKCISLSEDAERILKLFIKVKPPELSISKAIIVAAQEYISNHKKDNSRISDFVSEDVSSLVPSFFGDLDQWKKIIEKIPPAELKKIQIRHRQIDNIIRRRVESLL